MLDTDVPLRFGLGLKLPRADGIAGPVDDGDNGSDHDGELDFSDPQGVARGVAAGVI